MAEWLGRGLQNLLQRFNSASGLDEKGLSRNPRQPLFHGARLSRITPEPRESSVSPSAGNILRFIPRGDPRSGYFSSGLCRTTHSAATFPRRRRRSSHRSRRAAAVQRNARRPSRSPCTGQHPARSSGRPIMRSSPTGAARCIPAYVANRACRTGG